MEDLLSYYTLFTGFLTAVWAVIFFGRKELRREMIILGVLAVFLMPLIFTINQIDATEVTAGFANVGLVDLVFSFVLAGIAGTLYHALFGKHYHKLPKSERHESKEVAQLWIMRFFIAFLTFIWAVVLLHIIFEVALPGAFFIAAVMLAIYTTSHRHDLLEDALWSSFLTAFVVYLSTILAGIFTETNFEIAPIVSGVTILGAPADLLLWSMAAGLGLGPLYEYIRTLELE